MPALKCTAAVESKLAFNIAEETRKTVVNGTEITAPIL